MYRYTVSPRFYQGLVIVGQIPLKANKAVSGTFCLTPTKTYEGFPPLKSNITDTAPPTTKHAKTYEDIYVSITKTGNKPPAYRATTPTDRPWLTKQHYNTLRQGGYHE